MEAGPPVTPTLAIPRSPALEPGVSPLEPPAGGVGFPTERQTNLKIDPNKDLWQNIAMNVKDVANEQHVEMTVLVVGCRNSGKTSIIHRMLSLTQQAKPTTGLEYFYGKREERNVTQIAHFWELAQGRELGQLSDVVVTPENIHTAVALIVVDCSDPGTAWETVDYWLKRLDHRVQEIYQRMKAKNSTTPDKMVSRMKQRIGESHPDLSQMRIIGIPIVIIASKLDMYKQDGPKLKLMARALRYVAHLYGASVIFTSEQEREATKMRALLSSTIFQVPLDQKHTQTDIERGGVLVPAGRDSFRDIGDRPVVSMAGFKPSGDAELDRWKVAFDDAFPARQERGSEGDAEFFDTLYDCEKGAGEPLIDAMRKQKDEELEQYRRSSAKKAAEEKQTRADA